MRCFWGLTCRDALVKYAPFWSDLSFDSELSTGVNVGASCWWFLHIVVTCASKNDFQKGISRMRHYKHQPLIKALVETNTHLATKETSQRFSTQKPWLAEDYNYEDYASGRRLAKLDPTKYFCKGHMFAEGSLNGPIFCWDQTRCICMVILGISLIDSAWSLGWCHNKFVSRSYLDGRKPPK